MGLLEGLAVGESLSTEFGQDATGSLLAVLAGILVVFLVVMLALYIYSSFAYMAIGRRAKLSYPGLAWIPGVGPLIISFRASKMHWWPWLLLASGILIVIPLLGILLTIIGSLIFMVYSYIWSWKMFEAVGRPGWWALTSLLTLGVIIPFLGIILYIGGIVLFLVLLGIAAWGNPKE